MSLTLEIHRLRERVRHLETQLAANQSAVTQTNDQLQQLFHQVQHIDAQLRHWPPDGSGGERPSRGTKKSLTFFFARIIDYFLSAGKKGGKIYIEASIDFFLLFSPLLPPLPATTCNLCRKNAGGTNFC